MFFLQAQNEPDFIRLEDESITGKYIDNEKKSKIFKEYFPKKIEPNFSIGINNDISVSPIKKECLSHLETEILYSFFKIGFGFENICFQKKNLEYYIFPKKFFLRTDLQNQSIIFALFYSISQLNNQLPDFLRVDPFLEHNSAQIKAQYESKYNDHLMGKVNNFLQGSVIYQILFKEFLFSRFGLGFSATKKDNFYLDLLIAYEFKKFPFFRDFALLFRLESSKKEKILLGDIAFGFLHKNFALYLFMGAKDSFPSAKFLIILSNIIKNFFKSTIEKFIKFLNLAIGIDFDSSFDSIGQGKKYLLFRILCFEFKKDLSSSSTDFSINFSSSWSYKR